MKPGTPPLQSSRLLDQLRERIRYMHYSLSTEKVYAYRVRFFVRWSAQDGAMRHPRDIGAPGIEAFLTMLATERKVSASTHNQALSALLFLYREVLNVDLPWLNDINRPAQKRRIPCVLTKDEVAGVFAHIEGPAALVTRLLYGTGMRLMEGMRLRIKDVDFERLVIIVRDAKGGKDRVVMLPRSLVAALRKQMYAARGQWEADRQSQRGGVEVPHALGVKYPKVGHTWAWFWMFPSPTLSVDPRSGVERRHHLYEDRVQRALKVAVIKAGIPKPVSVHTLRHYSGSRNMPRRPSGKGRAARGKTVRSLGIVSPATLCGVTGDDRDSSIRLSAASGGNWIVLGTGAAPCRADAGKRIRAGVDEDFDRSCARLRGLARPARDLWPKCRGQSR